MKKYLLLHITLLLCFFSQLALASPGTGGYPKAECNIATTGSGTSGDVSVYFSILADKNKIQLINETYFYLFSTAASASSQKDVVIADDELRDPSIHGKRFNVLITYTKADQSWRYYRRPFDEANTEAHSGSIGGHWGKPRQVVKRSIDNQSSMTFEFNDWVDDPFRGPLSCDNEIPELNPQYKTQNAKYEFGVANCNYTTDDRSPCSIHFKQKFDIEPVLFVMPTIGGTSNNLDKSATLRVTDVHKDHAQVIQIEAREVRGNNQGTLTPMNSVSYLAIEPGIAELNGHTVYVDRVPVRELIGSKDEDRASLAKYYPITVDFARIPGFTAFSSKPTVFAEIQGEKNHTYEAWLTVTPINLNNVDTDNQSDSMGKDSDVILPEITLNTVNLSLDMSRANYSSDHDYSHEYVGILARKTLGKITRVAG